VLGRKQRERSWKNSLRLLFVYKDNACLQANDNRIYTCERDRERSAVPQLAVEVFIPYLCDKTPPPSIHLPYGFSGSNLPLY
jgi:hypothetical protein